MASSDAADLLVVGGGINGAGIARDAAGRGLKVVLCEQDDLGSHTSSASSKLIHGGLRYLEYYEFRLVREALIEREVLLRAAPHIIWPLRFVLPHSPEQRPVWMIRVGLFMYDHLGGRDKLPGSSKLDLRRDPAGAPLKEHVTTGFAYADCWVEDSRLVVLNAIDAAERGAEILTRTRCTSARRDGGAWVVVLEDRAGGRREMRARVIVNAAGPWVSRFLIDHVDLPALNKVRLVKGSHIVVPKLFDHGSPYSLQNPDKRIVFAIPYERDYTLIGTTDADYEGDPSAVAAQPQEAEYLCTSINRYFKRQIRPEDVVWSYAGVRPLFDDSRSDASAVTRDYVFDLDAGDGKPAIFSVFGGKITTYRRLAEHAMEKLKPVMGFEAGPWTGAAPLPGGDMPNADFDAFLERVRADHPWLPPTLAKRYARAYGTRLATLLGPARSLDDLGEHFGDDLYGREVDYLLKHEFARTDEDILWRRSKLRLHLGDETMPRLRARLASNQPRRAAGAVA